MMVVTVIEAEASITTKFNIEYVKWCSNNICYADWTYWSYMLDNKMVFSFRYEIDALMFRLSNKC